MSFRGHPIHQIFGNLVRQEINCKLPLFVKQCRYSSNDSLIYFLYMKQSVQTIIKLIMKCGLLYFTKKVASRKNCDFLKIPNFSKFTIFVKTPRNWWPLDKNSREFGSPQDPKMQEYMGFPEFLSQNSEFSRKIFTKIFSFHEIPGSTFSWIPGNFGRQNPGKCRNIRVSHNSRAEFQIFPGKFLRKF